MSRAAGMPGLQAWAYSAELASLFKSLGKLPWGCALNFSFYPESCSEWLFYLDPPQAPRNWERSKYTHLGILVSILGPFTVAL